MRLELRLNADKCTLQQRSAVVVSSAHLAAKSCITSTFISEFFFHEACLLCLADVHASVIRLLTFSISIEVAS